MARERGRWRPAKVTLLVIGIGLLSTASVVFAASTAHQDNETRLTRQRTDEAGAVLAASVPGIEGRLASSASIPDIATEGNATVFRRIMGGQVGTKARFVSASVWPVGGGAPAAVLGEAPMLAEQPDAEVEAFLERAVESGKMSVIGMLDGGTRRVGYAFAASGADDVRYLVYAEQALPDARTSVVDPSSPFAGLDFAIYLGPGEAESSLLAASTDDLPLEGNRAETDVPLGDRRLRLVMSPTGDLGGAVSRQLPWMALAAGLATTAGAALLTEQLHRRRRVAESLAVENAWLYREQRAGSLTLQHNLLPRSLPEVEGVEVEVRYVAGVADTEVGGDWYDLVAIERGLALTVGDVSGRGLAAAGVMASIRYTTRAFAAQGLDPDQVLVAADAVLDDGGPITHFATAVCAAVDLEARTITVADAGHPRPLLIGNGVATWVEVDIGPPLGMRAHGTYVPATIAIPPRATLLFVTDGLYERRGEPIDVGLERLRAAAAAASHATLREMVDHLLDELTGGTATDDTAILALRWER